MSRADHYAVFFFTLQHRWQSVARCSVFFRHANQDVMVVSVTRLRKEIERIVRKVSETLNNDQKRYFKRTHSYIITETLPFKCDYDGVFIYMYCSSGQCLRFCIYRILEQGRIGRVTHSWGAAFTVSKKSNNTKFIQINMSLQKSTGII